MYPVLLFSLCESLIYHDCQFKLRPCVGSLHLTSLSLQRRDKSLREKGLLFVGSGVSGGEDGARYGPSLMPGGSEEAW